ncbi:MAG: CapA family protein, partial [Patescibacteria group bacterium]
MFKFHLPLIFIFFVISAFFLAVKIIDVPQYAIETEKSREMPQVLAEKEVKETVLLFGGDAMLSRVVGQRMEKYGFNWPWEKIKDQLLKADISVINLESPFLLNSNYLVPTGSFSFKADPKAVSGLEDAGIDLVSLANNHFGNQGQKGMLDTFKVLGDIKYVGAGKDIDSAHQGEIMEVNGIKFGFLGYGYPEILYVAGKNAGIADMDLEKMRQDVVRMKKEADVVIVLMHAGIEYVNTPNKQQKDFAHLAIDSGADLVIGHHPHWVQLFEKYKGKPIFYSLGNLVFD